MTLGNVLIFVGKLLKTKAKPRLFQCKILSGVKWLQKCLSPCFITTSTVNYPLGYAVSRTIAHNRGLKKLKIVLCRVSKICRRGVWSEMIKLFDQSRQIRSLEHMTHAITHSGYETSLMSWKGFLSWEGLQFCKKSEKLGGGDFKIILKKNDVFSKKKAEKLFFFNKFWTLLKRF